MSKVAIILGMHRSGTSLIANYIQKLGIDIGERLLEKHDSNKDGHFEDLDFLEFHRSILRSNNLDDFLFDENIEITFDESYLTTASNLSKKKSKKNNQWGWKEPRTCLFVNLWNMIIKDSVYIISFRNPELVIDSVLRRRYNEIKARSRGSVFKKISFSKSIISFYFNKNKFINQVANTWLNYNCKILQVVNTRPSFVIDVDDISSQYKKLELFLKSNNFLINSVDFDSIYKPEFINNSTERISNIKNKQLRTECFKVYNQLKSVSTNKLRLQINE